MNYGAGEVYIGYVLQIEEKEGCISQPHVDEPLKCDRLCQPAIMYSVKVRISEDQSPKVRTQLK